MARSTKPSVTGFESQIHNVTPWVYPIDVHAALCHELNVNPKVWVLPAAFKPMFQQYHEDLEDVQALSNETGNLLFFYDDRWTEPFRKWVIHHEMFHQSQFYDLGNVGGIRWSAMSQERREAVWELEATNFANERAGIIGQDFEPFIEEQPDAVSSTVLPRQIGFGEPAPDEAPDAEPVD